MKFDNKNVLLVLQVGTLGGAERQALGLGKFLVNNKNCNVDILFIASNNRTKEFDDFFKTTGIKNSFYFGFPHVVLRKELSVRNLKRLKWSVQYFLLLKKGLKKNNYDIVVPFLNTPSKISYYLYKLLPTVKYTFWHQLGLDFLKKDIYESIAVNNMPCIIGNADNCFDIFKNEYVVKNKVFNLLPQYLTLKKENRDSDIIKEKYNISKGDVVFGMIAHFKSFKYHDLALKIFDKLAKNIKNIHLVLLGNKDNDEICLEIYNNLNESISKMNLSDKVTLLSNEDVTDVLNILDIGMLLSLIEGTPNVIMEYMLYALPVISSNHPGCVGLLEDSKFLVNNTEEEIYQAMYELAINERLRKAEGNRNAQYIKKYDIETYVKKLEIILTNSFE
ncbi:MULTISPECIES: glycosyltransferase family 4 protein [Flavobacteriaceae]|uniref:glycosyltransferase family 4 protein n=1 Tax=Flavobacteriaceae TaxID=49546 RepID=UPI0010A90C2A|nr:glycosyltransferase family 4 protein [Psychroserpens sp. NJDZ02]QCE40120.1 glycosyltransferase family 4 protein [Psychroserpens sp. NJDZ02]